MPRAYSRAASATFVAGGGKSSSVLPWGKTGAEGVVDGALAELAEEEGAGGWPCLRVAT
jgi:hypothetical protein